MLNEIARAATGAIQATAAPSTPPRPDASVSSTVDFQSFLRLLTAQLRFQDPLAPIDSTQFVAQLSGFSTVEQLVNANRKLDEIAARLERDTSKQATPT
jgi:flagellar basal-body rod modification protein FlgD